MRHAKAYADEMYESEEALERATGHKQAIRSRMHVLEASLFTGHGYEFTRTVGDEKFTARKLKRGSKPADTVETGTAASDTTEELPDNEDLETGEGAGESLADA
jgi:hypothetical protein